MSIALTLLDPRGRALDDGLPFELLAAGEVLGRAESSGGEVLFEGVEPGTPDLHIRLDKERLP